MHDLNEVLAAYAQYNLTVKQHRRLDRDIAAHIAVALPEGISFTWYQGSSFQCPIVFPTTEDSLTKGFYLDDGLAQYTKPLQGLSRSALRYVIKAWKALPHDLLQKAFGDSQVTVHSDGDFIVNHD